MRNKELVDELDDVYSGSENLGYVAYNALLTILRHDWAKQVLDALAITNGYNVPSPQFDKRMSPHWMLFVWASDSRVMLQGSTPDAARHVAALAVWPTLPEAERKRIGECP